jgi:hypothetical protein
MTDNETNAPLAQPEPADLSGVSWPDSGPITARAVFADGKCYLLDTQPEPEPEKEVAELVEGLQLEDELDDD